MPPPCRVFLRVFSSKSSSRAYSTRPTFGAPIIHIPKANIYPFGASPSTPPSLKSVEWTVNEGEAWAVVSSSRGGAGKSILFQVFLSLIHKLNNQPSESKDTRRKQPHIASTSLSRPIPVLEWTRPIRWASTRVRRFPNYRGEGRRRRRVLRLYSTLWGCKGRR